LHNLLDPPLPPLAAGVLVVAGDEHGGLED
jgi:hypothetical protein